MTRSDDLCNNYRLVLSPIASDARVLFTCEAAQVFFRQKPTIKPHGVSTRHTANPGCQTRAQISDKISHGDLKEGINVAGRKEADFQCGARQQTSINLLLKIDRNLDMNERQKIVAYLILTLNYDATFVTNVFGWSNDEDMRSTELGEMSQTVKPF